MKRFLALFLTIVMLWVMVSCKPSQGTEPQATTPEVTTPEVTTPEATTPEEITTPEVTAPEETTPEDVLSTVEKAKSFSELCALPVVMTTVREELYETLRGKIQNLCPLKLQKKYY